jgi:LmbE family N-acetylglucosaminyl deacetylase
MQLHDLRQIHNDYQHIYLSPHLDDAALSCGGNIARQRARGERVLVVTICTGAPAPGAPLNALAQELHDNWRLSAETAVSARIAEDRAAMDVLDADYFYLGLLDAIYRNPAYASREALFGTPVDDDTLADTIGVTIRSLHSRAPNAMIYGPLGVGSHVDHLGVYQACASLAGQIATIVFYEDIPYALVPGSVEKRLSALGPGHEPQEVEVGPLIERKLAAIAAYASQMGELFGGPDQMPPAIYAYAASVRPPNGNYGERLWR